MVHPDQLSSTEVADRVREAGRGRRLGLLGSWCVNRVDDSMVDQDWH